MIKSFFIGVVVSQILLNFVRMYKYRHDTEKVELIEGYWK